MQLKNQKLKIRMALILIMIPGIAFASSNEFSSIFHNALNLFNSNIVRFIVAVDVIYAIWQFYEGSWQKSTMLKHVIGGAALLSSSWIASQVFGVSGY